MAVALQIGGNARTLTEWDQATITVDMLAPGCPFTVTLHRAGREESWQELLEDAVVFAPLVAEVNGAVQVRGLIRRRRTGADRQGRTLTVSGTDYAGVATIAEVPPTYSLKNTPLATAIERLYAPLRIPVTVGAAAASAMETQTRTRRGSRGGTRARRRHAVDAIKVRGGEPIQAIADALCRRHGYLLYTAPFEGGVGLVIDRPNYDAAVRHRLTRRLVSEAPERYEGNVITAARDVDGTRVPSEVTVFGHSGASSSSDTRVKTTVANAGLDHPLVAAERYPLPRYVRDRRARSPQVAEQRGRREVARAMGDFDVYTATVRGFSFDGLVWAVNTMVRIEDEVEGVDGDWLVTRVEFSQNRQTGPVTNLRLVPKGALVIEPDEDGA